MQALVGGAAFAGGKMLFVIAAPLRRQAGAIVAPAGQDLSYYGINALTHKLLLKADAFSWGILCGQHHPVANQRHLRAESVLSRTKRDLRMIVLFRQMRQHYV